MPSLMWQKKAVGTCNWALYRKVHGHSISLRHMLDERSAGARISYTHLRDLEHFSSDQPSCAFAIKQESSGRGRRRVSARQFSPSIGVLRGERQSTSSRFSQILSILEAFFSFSTVCS